MSRLGLAVLLTLIALAFAGPDVSPAGAINLPVTRFDDPAPVACAPSDCSLREAIIAANLTFGPDVITLPSGPYTLAIAGADEDAAATGDLDITDEVTINGAGAGTTSIDGADLDRVFHVLSATVSIASVTIRNGNTTGQGGGIYSDGGTVTLTNSTVSGNTAAHSGGIYNFFSTLTLTNSAVSGNMAGGDAGGINNAGSTLTLTNSTISGNMAGTRGGGIFNNGGSEVVTNSTISGNTAGTLGGGMYLASGGLGGITVTGSTISGNTAGTDGGGIVSSAGLTLTNSTISGNMAVTNGGGIYNFASTITVLNSTITNNTADSDESGTGDGGGIARTKGTVNLKSTVLGGNFDSSSDPDCSGTVTSQGYNLIQTVSAGCNIDGDPTGNVAGVDANLGPLANNGGPTQTHALLPGSFAIDGGSPDCPPPATDQRGVARPINGDAAPGARCDIGAFEAPAPATPTPTPSPTPSSTPPPTPSPTPTATPTPSGTETATPTPIVTPTITPAPERLAGDLNCDGVVDALDALAALRFAAGLPPPAQQEPCPNVGGLARSSGIGPAGDDVTFGDLDCDGDVDPVDALAVLRHVAGLPPLAQQEPCPDVGTPT